MIDDAANFGGPRRNFQTIEIGGTTFGGGGALAFPTKHPTQKLRGNSYRGAVAPAGIAIGWKSDWLEARGKI